MRANRRILAIKRNVTAPLFGITRPDARRYGPGIHLDQVEDLWGDPRTPDVR